MLYTNEYLDLKEHMEGNMTYIQFKLKNMLAVSIKQYVVHYTKLNTSHFNITLLKVYFLLL